MDIKPDVASVRVGEIAGIHTVGFEGGCDRITMEHEAFSRQGFAEGAVMAASMADAQAEETLARQDGVNPQVTPKPMVHEFKELFIGTLK